MHVPDVLLRRLFVNMPHNGMRLLSKCMPVLGSGIVLYLINMSTSRSSVQSLSCTPLPLVRIGFIGLGKRGMATLRRYQYVAGACVVAVADFSTSRIEAAQQVLSCEYASSPSMASVAKEVHYYEGAAAAQRLMADENVDVVYICTDWSSHTPLAVAAMLAGKHVAVEVPAATTLEECWQLVKTAEATQRHCFMTENCCYDWFALTTRSLHQQGFFGTLTHCEGAYCHDWRKFFGEDASGCYLQGALHGGNPYPTHGIGPIGQLLRDRDDRMLRLVAMTSQTLGTKSPLGHVSSSLITTEKGMTILLQFDCTTPRPYSRLQTLCGTQAFGQKYPLVTLQTDNEVWTGEAAEARCWAAPSNEAIRLWQEGKARGVENPMNYAMDCRFVQCLQRGLPLDIDVYDAADWSALAELTLRSAREGGQPVDIPNFRP